MKTATFYGTSYDSVKCVGPLGEDEFEAYNSDDHYYAGYFILGGKMKVHAIYDGCWSFAVGRVHETVPLPLWPPRVLQSEDYPDCAALEIDVPDDTTVVWVQGCK